MSSVDICVPIQSMAAGQLEHAALVALSSLHLCALQVELTNIVIKSDDTNDRAKSYVGNSY